MAKSTYSVVVIRKGHENDYFDLWKRGIKINASGEELHSGLVGFTETVEAKNKQDAVSLTQKKYPELTVDIEATQRHGLNGTA